MLSEERLQQLIKRKDPSEAKRGESWAIIDRALVIHDFTDPPSWLPDESERDEDNNTVDFYK